MRFPFDIDRSREFDVVGFGTNAVDFLIEVPEYPAFNSKIELTDYAQAAGGEVATTMAGLQRLGLRTTYVGAFGDDPSGAFGLRSLSDEGVDVEHARVVKGARTQIAFIVIDSRNGERTVIWKRDKNLAFSVEDAPTHIVSGASLLHVTPHDTKAALAMAQTAKRSGTVVSIDVDKAFPGIEDLLSQVDLLIASSEFPSRLLGIDDHRKALPEMAQRFGCRVCGVTLGERGSLLFAGGVFIESAGYAVPGGCRDTTGAGDAFRVGLVYGLLNNSGIEDAARYANAVAALKCRAIGARTALPNEKELKQFLSNNTKL